MSSRVTIKVAGAKKGFVTNTASFIKILSDKHLSAISQEAARTMREKIKDGIQRADSTGTLESNIQAEKVSEGRYGVGNIPRLNQVAPYWNHVDKGSVVVGAAHSHRVPTGFFMPGNPAPIAGGSGDRWNVGGRGGYSFVPRNPIRPMNYVAQTIFEHNRIVLNVLRTVK